MIDGDVIGVNVFINDHDFLGLEYDWLGVSSDGLIGYYSTAGIGPIPKVCNTEELFDGVFEEIELLDEVTSINQISGFDKNCEDWLMVASKGFYAFDWSRTSSKYELIAIPEKPLLFGAKDISNRLYGEIDQVHLDACFVTKVGLSDLIEFN